MPLGFANFRHDPTVSSRDRQQQYKAGAQQQQQQQQQQEKVSSSAASISSEQSLIKDSKKVANNADGSTAKKNPLREMVDAIKPKQW